MEKKNKKLASLVLYFIENDNIYLVQVSKMKGRMGDRLVNANHNFYQVTIKPQI